jgi:hypothetical protein
MKTIEEIKQILSEHRGDFRKKYNVKEIGIFGSYSRNEQKEVSDVDILVEFEEPIGLAFVDLAEYLENLLSIKVDLVPRGAIKPRMWEYVKEDLVYV